MKPHRPKVTVTAAKPCLNDEIKPDLVKSLSRHSIVDPAQRHGGFTGLPTKISLELPLLNKRTESAPIRPRCHGTSLLLAD